jgi:hypothetical protein
MPKCNNCGKTFPKVIKINGRYLGLNSRKFCTECSPIGGKNTRRYIIELKEGEAFCAHCGHTKNKNEFYKRKYTGQPLSYCIDCQNVIKQVKFEEKLNLIVENRGGECSCCKNSYPISVFDFIKNGKVFKLSKIRNMSTAKILKEIKDCEMMCKNCIAILKWSGS